MTRTLLSLSLTSRQWTSSAVRSLHFDPTRCLNPVKLSLAAWKLLRKYIAQPELGARVQSLRCLPAILDAFAPCDEVEEAQISVWLLSLLRQCTNIKSIGICKRDDLDWSSELERFKGLRRLSVDSHDGILGSDYILPLLSELVFPPSVHTLVVSDFDIDSQEFVPPTCNLGTGLKHLTLRNFRAWLYSAGEFPLRAPALESLVLEPDTAYLEGMEHLAVPTLKHLTVRPLGPRIPLPDAYTQNLEAEYWPKTGQLPFSFEPFPRLPVLRVLTLEYVRLSLKSFAAVVLACPLLERLSLKDSTYRIVECETLEADLSFSTSIASRPSLVYVDLGFVPVTSPRELSLTTARCLASGVKLVFVPSLRFRRPEDGAASSYSDEDESYESNEDESDDSYGPDEYEPCDQDSLYHLC
jgi:hypothetical protein